MRAILDTNVLVSGIFFSGPPARILNAWRRGEVQFALTPEIIDEYIRVAGILAAEFSGIEINPILNLIITKSDIFQPLKLQNQVCEDPDDDKFLACALSSGSRIIISGDKHLLKLSEFQGITILTPRAFVARYLEN
jgi:putative PIN family toxin of toxin-antitoxin system